MPSSLPAQVNGGELAAGVVVGDVDGGGLVVGVGRFCTGFGLDPGWCGGPVPEGDDPGGVTPVVSEWPPEAAAAANSAAAALASARAVDGVGFVSVEPASGAVVPF